MIHRKTGQGSTEYLIILAAVLILALMVVFILNSSGSMQNNNATALYQSYWSALSPFAIADATQTGQTAAHVVVQNSGARELTLKSFTLLTDDGAHSYTNSTSALFTPGQKKTIGVTLDASALNCAPSNGKYATGYLVFITYDDDPITGKSFNSSGKLLPVLCS